MTSNEHVITNNDQNYIVNLPEQYNDTQVRAEELTTILFAHGAGAPMDSDYMNKMSRLFASKGIRVVRFEFPYMHQRRIDGKKRPPNREPICLDCWAKVIDDWADLGALYIAGKSMGGRMASILASKNCDAASKISAVLCLGYPFHAPGKTDKWRVDHFATLAKQTYIFQGERDPFGKREEIELLQKENASWPNQNRGKEVILKWIPDGDHDFKPRVKSGLTQQDNLELVSNIVVEIVS